DRGGCCLGRQRRRGTASRDDHGNLLANQIGRQFRQTIVLPAGPAIHDPYVLTLDIAVLLQALAKSAQAVLEHLRRCGTEEPNDRHRPLLRPRRKRPSGRRAAKQRDELPPLHSITSSASRRNDSGIESPSALAVLRLTRRAKFVGCTTGKSAGFSPRRTRAT